MRRRKNFGDILIDIFIFLFYILMILAFILIAFVMLSQTRYNKIIYFIFPSIFIICTCLSILCYNVSLFNFNSSYSAGNFKNSMLMFVISICFAILLLILYLLIPF